MDKVEAAGGWSKGSSLPDRDVIGGGEEGRDRNVLVSKEDRRIFVVGAESRKLRHTGQDSDKGDDSLADWQARVTQSHGCNQQEARYVKVFAPTNKGSGKKV